MKWVDIWVVNSPFFSLVRQTSSFIVIWVVVVIVVMAMVAASGQHWWRNGKCDLSMSKWELFDFAYEFNIFPLKWMEKAGREKRDMGVSEWVSESVCIKHIKHILSPGQFYLQHINFAARRQIRYPTVRLGASYLLAQTIGSSRAISCFTNFFQRQRFDMSDSIYVWLLHG